MCALLILSASAAQGADQGFYFGASAGQAKYDFDGVPAVCSGHSGAFGFMPVATEPSPIPPVLVDRRRRSMRPPLSSLHGRCSGCPAMMTRVRAWSVTAGYRVNRYLAVEVELCEPRDARSHATPCRCRRSWAAARWDFIGSSRPAVLRSPHSASCRCPTAGSCSVRAGILFADSELTTCDQRQLEFDQLRLGGDDLGCRCAVRLGRPLVGAAGVSALARGRRRRRCQRGRCGRAVARSSVSAVGRAV